MAPEERIMSFAIPEKRIKSKSDILLFMESKTFRDLQEFISLLNISVRNCNYENNDSTLPRSETVKLLYTLLDKVDKLIDEVSIDKSSARFGNIAFRTWHSLLETNCHNWLKKLFEGSMARISNYESTDKRFLKSWSSACLSLKDALTSEATVEQSVVEVNAYLTSSFGDVSRIDYGSGHELNFLAFLYCLFRLKILDPEDAKEVVLYVFRKYIHLVRKLILKYNMEPAGSKGAWGLDDYHFLPFIFGSSQLFNEPNMPPSVVTEQLTMKEKINHNFYFDAINWIFEYTRVSLNHASINFSIQTKANRPLDQCALLLSDISSVSTCCLNECNMPSDVKVSERFISIFYIIPEDHDEEDHPNVFILKGTDEASRVKLKDIRHAFPLNGVYHFRFKIKNGNSYVWMDVSDDEAFVPSFQSKIFAKVSRLYLNHQTNVSRHSVSEHPTDVPKSAPDLQTNILDCGLRDSIGMADLAVSDITAKAYLHGESKGQKEQNFPLFEI